MPNMGRIDQGDLNIDVEQKGHGSPSRSAFTFSGVTITFYLRTGSNGTPFRSADATGGRSELRASLETT